jgi:hypothetical protein
MAIDLPIRPNYWDFQYKTTTKINEKTTLTTLGVGAIDEFSFAIPQESTPEKEYILRNSPNINQWNYTLGSVLKRRIERGFINFSASRNMFNNQLDKYEDGNDGDEKYRTLKTNSQEIENKFRIDVNQYLGKWKYSYGGMLQYVKYNNQTFSKISNGVYDTSGNLITPAISINFNSDIEFFKVGVFGEISRRMLNDRLNVNLGIRSDINSFTNTGMNLLKTLSPRVSGSFAITEKLSINATMGRYFKIPIYTVIGYKNNLGEFVNKDNEYISCNHYVAGVEYLPTNSMRITMEGFYKQYSNYPVSVNSGISLANLGADYSSLGNEKTLSTGIGRTFGFELFFQQKLTKNLFATLSYTWFVSEFSGVDNILKPSAWDNRNLISAIVGYKFKKGWELGMKYRYAGGAPYSPFDMNASRSNYLTIGSGVLDYNQLNSLRLNPFHQLDLRIDKKINLSRIALDFFIDITNVLLLTSESFPYYTFERTSNNASWKSTDGTPVQTNGANAIPLIIPNTSSTVIPTFGFILEF